jgi:hypothetical protein
VIRRFEVAVGVVFRVGVMMKSAVGEGAAQALVEEQEQQSDLNAPGG